MTELMAHGQAVYGRHCASCHQENGEGIPGTFPAIRGSRIVNGPRDGHLKLVANGKGDLMPAFKGVLSAEEIAAVITYERNALGNHQGDMIQPSEAWALQAKAP